MDVQTVNVAAQEAQPPPGGQALGKGTLLAGSPDTQAAFQSLMASLMAPLLAAQTPQPMMMQQATGDAQASTLATVTSAANGAQMLQQMGQDAPVLQGTGTQGAAATAQPADLMSMIQNAGKPLQAAVNASTTQTQAQQSLPVDGTTTLDALRSLASAQTGAATAEGAAATSAQTASTTVQAAQVFAAEGEQAEKPAAPKADTSAAQTPFASAFAANVNAAAATQGSVEVKPSNASPVQQIADQVQMTLNRGENSATIRLQPAELGGVRIRIQVQDGQLHLSIEAEKSGTGQLIDQQIGSLRQNLESSGMRIGDLAVLAGGRGHTPGVETMQREAAQTLRTMQMEMGNQQFQQQQQHAHQQQAAFAGQDGQQRQQGQFDPAQVLGDARPGGQGAINAAGLGNRNIWQTAAYAAVDYYA
ncbi:MAG: flagellar hook-length control protein FliK [Caldilineaceae bacterium]|nr:flagellar hook-length control protein FliK [Caldilineaceae bacterium]